MDVKNWEELASKRDLWRQELYESLEGEEAKHSVEEQPENDTYWHQLQMMLVEQRLPFPCGAPQPQQTRF